MLAQYECSTGTLNGTVPGEILQSATRIDDRHANILQAGPTDAVDTDTDDEKESKATNKDQPKASTRSVDGCFFPDASQNFATKTLV